MVYNINVSNNEGTKKQIRDWLEDSIRKAQNPDPRELMKRKRVEKAKKIEKNYGL